MSSLAMLSYRFGSMLTNALKLSSISIALLFFSQAILAKDIPEAVTQAVASLIPDTEPDSITDTPISNLYLVTFGTQIAYISADGRYLLTGDMIDIESGRNLAEAIRSNYRKKLIQNLDDSGMVVFSPNEVRSTITVFTDISCTYCVRFHREINDIVAEGIQVRYAGFPRAGIPSGAHDALVSVWCSNDPQRAMTDAKEGIDIERRTCHTSIEEHMEVAESIGVRGTPTIVLESGRMIPGYVPAAQLVLEVSMELD